MKKRLLFLFCLAVAQTDAQNPADVQFKASIDSQINQLMLKYHIVGSGIALFDSEQMILQQGYGFADLPNKVAIQEQTIFRVGSISKTFTALAVMQLKEAGKIELNAPIEEYLPALHLQNNQQRRKITSRDLLTHTAGLTDDISNGNCCNRPVGQQVVIDWLNQEVLTIPPGLKMNYSNIGYALLGYLIEAVSGEKYADYIEQHIFRPLHMDHSSVSIDSSQIALRVKGYKKDGVELEVPPVRDLAAGSVESSLPDMVAFAQMLLRQGQVGTDSLISRATFVEMSSDHLADVVLGAGDRFGYGLFLQYLGTDQDEKIGYGIGHGGDLFNHHAVLMIYPKLNLGLVTLTNSEEGNKFCNNAAVRVLKTYLKTYKHLAMEKAAPDRFPVQALAVDRLDHRLIQGIYGGNGEDYVRIKNAGPDKLKFMQSGHLLILRRQENNTYSVKFRLLKFIPIRMKDMLFAFKQVEDKTYLEVLNNKDKSAEFISMRDPTGALDQRWRDMQGNYEVINLFPTTFAKLPYMLKCKDNMIVVHVKSPFSGETDNLGFYPLSPTVAVADGIDRGAGATLRILPNGNLYYSGFEMKKVR
ncbi:MAG: serine hydrolase domain-containing protein [Saprospiraceae bacterium]